MYFAVSSVMGSLLKQLELRRADKTYMESGSEFYSAHADANCPVVAFEMAAEIRRVTAASTG